MSWSFETIFTFNLSFTMIEQMESRFLLSALLSASLLALEVPGVATALNTQPSATQATTSALNITSIQHGAISLSTADMAYIKSHLDEEPWKSGYASLAGDWRS